MQLPSRGIIALHTEGDAGPVSSGIWTAESLSKHGWERQVPKSPTVMVSRAPNKPNAGLRKCGTHANAVLLPLWSKRPLCSASQAAVQLCVVLKWICRSPMRTSASAAAPRNPVHSPLCSLILSAGISTTSASVVTYVCYPTGLHYGLPRRPVACRAETFHLQQSGALARPLNHVHPKQLHSPEPTVLAS